MDRETARKRAEALVDQMTVEEMASQLRFDAPEIPRLGIPAYNWWNEGLHGVARAGTATVFPQTIGLGATFDPELARKTGRAVALEARAKYNAASAQNDRDIYKGLTVWSPNVNIFRDPRWGRGHETYGEDPELTGRMAVEFIHGLQGDGEYLMTAACAKHFAVHSGPEALRHSFDAQTSHKDLWETYLPAFEACVTEGNVEAVMGAYNRTNGEPCCAHSYLMEEVLRGQWGFQGHFVSDCWAIQDFYENHHITGRPEESVRLALERGCDVNCGCTYQRILNAYEEGILPAEYIRRSAVRLFTTRFLLGLFDKTPYDDIPYEVVESPEHLALAERSALESMVLLKNDGILPLNADKYKTIGVVGPNANSRRALMGNYHGTASRYITLLEGIQDQVGEKARVLYAQGCHLFKDREEPLALPNDRISEAKTVALHSDVVILCLGLDETLEGEEGDTGNSYASGDKADLLLPPSQRRLLQAVAETGVPMVICMMTGSAMDLTEETALANAILQVWYPGARGGKAAAKLLFGKASPSGKLPVTFYRNSDPMPDFTDYSMKGRTYRYLEHPPLYPFGFGLTYGDCVVTSVKTEGAPNYHQALEQGLAIEVTAENRGELATGEVLQVYLHVEGSGEEVPNPKLAAFQRIYLNAGETKTCYLKIPGRAFRVVDQAGSRVPGTGCSVCVGFNQPDDRSQALTGKDCMHIQL